MHPTAPQVPQQSRAVFAAATGDRPLVLLSPGRPLATIPRHARVANDARNRDLRPGGRVRCVPACCGLRHADPKRRAQCPRWPCERNPSRVSLCAQLNPRRPPTAATVRVARGVVRHPRGSTPRGLRRSTRPMRVRFEGAEHSPRHPRALPRAPGPRSHYPPCAGVVGGYIRTSPRDIMWVNRRACMLRAQRRATPVFVMARMCGRLTFTSLSH